MSDPVIIVNYDPRWALMYEEERARILTAIGRHLVGIEHVGSTAVPGLAAKPIIDIMPGVRTLADAAHCVAPLRALGYDDVPAREAQIPERRLFRKGPRGAESHHLHMVEVTSAFWERHILFRDYLRAHPDIATEYAALKHELAVRYQNDRDGYTDAKTSFIQAIEERARRERTVS
jgi:GrpB-like predicted nucleotidyltransferase (UPF0157 family)